MIVLGFDASRIEDWAAFSGDRNPIHFDEGAARRLGADDVIVHGMLPILHAQAASARACASMSPPGGWREWHARLKWPLLRGRQAHLRLDASPGGCKFALTDPEGSKKYFHGRFERIVRKPEEPAPEVDDLPCVQIPPIRFDAGVLASRGRAFREVFPDPGESAWICVSAITFARFLSDGTGALRQAALRLVFGEGQAPDVDRDVTVVQTTHAVRYDADYFDGRAIDDIPRAECAFTPAQLFKVENGCSGSVQWTVSADGQCVMELAVGLMLRV